MRQLSIILSFTFCILAICPAHSFAQYDGSVLVSNGVFIDDPEIKEVCDLWQKYLQSHPDTVQNNPLWNDHEKKLYPTGDLLRQTFLGNVYELMAAYKPTILSITPEGEYYKIRTLFGQQQHDGLCDAIAITNVYAKKENGHFVLYNSLPIATADWLYHRVGSITFVCPRHHVFNPAEAEKLRIYVDSITNILHVTPRPATYYYADTKEELFHAQGLDYFMGEGNAPSSSGFSDIKNGILYGAGSEEWYPHEFVHLYANPKFKNADPMLLEGLAIFFGGSRGHSADWLMKHGDSLLSANHTIDIDRVISEPWSGNLDYITTVDGLFGCLICKMAYQKGGVDLLLKIMEYGPLPDAGRFKILKEVFGIKREDVSPALRKKIAEYAAKVPKNTQ